MADPQQTSPAPQPSSFLEWLKTVPLWQKVKKFWKLIAGTGIASIVLYFLSILANLSQIGMNWALQLTWDWICRAAPFVLISLTIAFLAAFAYYLWFIKKTKKLYYIIPIGLLISFGLAAIIFLGFKPSDPKHVKIVVANFYNFNQGEDKDNEVTDMVFGDLKKALRPFSDVELEPLGTAITERKGGSDTANKLGQEQQADIVIWGSYVEKSDGKQLRTHFDVMTSTGKLKYMPTLGKEAQGEVRLFPAEMKSFSLTLKLAQEMTYLSLFTVGMARYSAEDWDGAIDRFTAALSQTAEDVPALSKGVVYFYRGTASLQKGNADFAIQDYNKSLEIDPKFAKAYTNRGFAYAIAYTNRGVIYLWKGNSDLAIQDFTKSIELDPKYAVTYYNRGVIYLWKGKSDLAIQDFTKSIELDPKYAVAYTNRGVAYHDKGNSDLAIQDFTKSIELDPKLADAYYNRGFAYASKGNSDLAIQDYTKAIELDPKYAVAYNNRGLAYHDKGNSDLAIQDFTKSIELYPKLADVYYNRGLTYNKKGNSDLAVQDFTKSIELYPKDAEAYINRGFAYYVKGDKAKAIADYREALKLTNDPSMQQDLEKRLRDLEAQP